MGWQREVDIKHAVCHSELTKQKVLTLSTRGTHNTRENAQSALEKNILAATKEINKITKMHEATFSIMNPKLATLLCAIVCMLLLSCSLQFVCIQTN